MPRITPMLAEVSDKVLAIGEIWIVAVLVSLGLLALLRWRRPAVSIALPLIVLWALAVTSEVRDAFVGPAIVAELGRGYVWQVYLAAIAPVVAVVFGYSRHRRPAA